MLLSRIAKAYNGKPASPLLLPGRCQGRLPEFISLLEYGAAEEEKKTRN
jgi:hypothetical protein